MDHPIEVRKHRTMSQRRRARVGSDTELGTADRWWKVMLDVPVFWLRIGSLGVIALGVLGPSSVASGPILCPLRAATGVPCPYCGLTRSITATATGDLAGAVELNPAGPAVVVLTLFSWFSWSISRLRLPVIVLLLISCVTLLWNTTLNSNF